MSRRAGRGRRSILVALAATLPLLVTGCMPQAVSSQGDATDRLYYLFFAAATVVFVIVAGLITFSIVRFRHRGPIPPTDASLPPQYHGNLILEAIWTTLPILTVLGLFAATFATLQVVQARSPDEITVNVTAFQWQWRFEYAGSGVAISGVTGPAGSSPEMVVPLDRQIHVHLTSADVNHAFFVPAFLFKQDAIPGHPNDFDFRVTTAGTYRGQCAEFCGVYHDRMTFSIRAVSASEFSSWLRQQQSAASPSPAASSAASASTAASPSS